MEYALFVLFLLSIGGLVWVVHFYLPKRRREQRDRYLDIIGEEGTEGIETGTLQRAGTGKRSDSYCYARLKLEGRWAALSCSLDPSTVPPEVEPLVHESPTETTVLSCWGHDAKADGILQDPQTVDGIRRFLNGYGHRTILGGQISIECHIRSVDAMAEVGMLTDIADLRSLFY